MVPLNVFCKSVVVFSILLSSFSSFGQAKKKSNSQWGQVRIAGAAVYQKPSFDSPVISYLELDQKVRVSTRRYEGIGGFGLFFKVRVKKGLIGYIPDTDVIPQSIAKKLEQSQEVQPVTKKTNESGGKNKRQEPLYFTRGISLAYGNVEYAEIVSGVKLSSSTSFLGVKLSGPGWLVAEAPLDVDILFAPEAPSYYDERLATSPASGFVFIGSAALKVPFADWQDKLIF